MIGSRLFFSRSSSKLKRARMLADFGLTCNFGQMQPRSMLTVPSTSAALLLKFLGVKPSKTGPKQSSSQRDSSSHTRHLPSGMDFATSGDR